MLSFRSIVAVAIFPLIAVDIGIAGCGTSSFSGEGSDSGSNDANANDAQPLDGASLDEASTGDAGPFCAGRSPAPYFCADFDEGDITTAYVGPSKSTVFAQSSFDSGIADLAPSDLSPPSLFSSSIPALPANTTAAGQILAIGLPNTSDGTGTDSVTFHLDFDFRLDAIDTVASNARIQVFQIALTSGALTPSLYRLDFMQGDVYVNVDGATDLNFGTLPEKGAWVHVTFVIVTGGTFEATVGSSATQSFASGASMLMTKPMLTVGLSSPGSSPAVQVSIENIKLTAHLPDGGLAIGDGGSGSGDGG